MVETENVNRPMLNRTRNEVNTLPSWLSGITSPKPTVDRVIRLI